MPDVKIYAGIGSREAPPDVLAVARRIGAAMAQDGWTLSTGASWGMDEAFMRGALDVGGRVDLWIPNTMFRIEEREASSWPSPPRSCPSFDAYVLAEKHHPAWHRCDETARALHARNGHVVLGDTLDKPVALVICWTREARAIGGTGQALRLAAHLGIKVRNLGDPAVMTASLKWLDQRGGT